MKLYVISENFFTCHPPSCEQISIGSSFTNVTFIFKKYTVCPTFQPEICIYPEICHFVFFIKYFLYTTFFDGILLKISIYLKISCALFKKRNQHEAIIKSNNFSLENLIRY